MTYLIFVCLTGEPLADSTEVWCKDVHTRHKGLRFGEKLRCQPFEFSIDWRWAPQAPVSVQVWSLHSSGRHKQALHIGQHKVNQDGHINEHPDHVPRGRVPQKTNQAEQQPDYDQDQSQGSGPVLQLP